MPDTEDYVRIRCYEPGKNHKEDKPIHDWTIQKHAWREWQGTVTVEPEEGHQYFLSTFHYDIYITPVSAEIK